MFVGPDLTITDNRHIMVQPARVRPCRTAA